MQHTGRMRAATLAGLEGLLQRVLWVLHCPVGYTLGYRRRAPLRACTVDRTRLRVGRICSLRCTQSASE